MNDAGDFRTLAGYLAQWDGRRRRQELLRGVPLGLLAGLLLALVAALLSRARPLLTRGELALLAVAASLIGLSAAGLIVMLRRRPPLDQARFADRQFSLRERATAAVEIQSGRLAAEPEIAARQLQDAISAAAAVDATREMPLRMRPDYWLPPLAALLLLAVALWLPNPQEAALLERRALAETIEEQSQALRELAETIAANDDLTAEQRDALLQPLEEALAALQQPGLSREEAVAALSGAEAELRSLSQASSDIELRKALAQAGAALDSAGPAGEVAAALQAGQPQQTAAALEKLANSLASLSAEELAALADQLAELAAQLAQVDPELAGTLAEAAGALANGDTTAAQSALSSTSSTLSERSAAATAATQAGNAADRLQQSRGEIAQAGSGEQPGDGGGNTSGSGQGNGTPGGQGGTQGGQQQSGAGGPSPGGGHVEDIFVPSRPDLGGEGQEFELETRCLIDPEACGPLGGLTPSDPNKQAPGGQLVPYDQVFGDYRDAAFEALRGGNIPVNLQNLVRDYFSALEP